MEMRPIAPVYHGVSGSYNDKNIYSDVPGNWPSSSMTHLMSPKSGPWNGNHASTNRTAMFEPHGNFSTFPDVQELAAVVPLGQSSKRTITETMILWKIELIAAAIALLLETTQIVLFAVYDGKFLLPYHLGHYHAEAWAFPFRINALFTLLTTIMNAAISSYLGACIGQLRWHFYLKKAHRLGWLDDMTNATGAMGAAKLIFKKGMHRQLVTVGAIMVILMLLVNTATQQAIKLVNGPFPPNGLPGGGKVPIQTAYNKFIPGVTDSIDDQRPVAALAAAVQSGFDSITDRANNLSASTIATCLGTKCDFGKYMSLAVCGACSDTPLPVHNAGNGSYVLSQPHGLDLSLSVGDGILNLTSDGNYPISRDLSDQVGPLIVRSVAMLRKDGTTQTGVEAVECAAWWCVNTYTSIMANGTLSENKTGTSYTSSKVNGISWEEQLTKWVNASSKANTTQDEKIKLSPSHCAWDGHHHPPGCDYWVGLRTHRSLQNYLFSNNPNIFDAPVLAGSASFVGNSENYNVTSLTVEALVESQGDYLPKTIRQAYTSMTDYLTVTLRQSKSAAQGYPDWQYGPATIEQPMFQTHWPWLTLPFFVVVVSTLFLLITMHITRNEDIWKSSVMAMMFHAFSDDDRHALGDLNTVKAMEQITLSQKVQMQRHDTTGQWRFRTTDRQPASSAW